MQHVFSRLVARHHYAVAMELRNLRFVGVPVEMRNSATLRRSPYSPRGQVYRIVPGRRTTIDLPLRPIIVLNDLDVDDLLRDHFGSLVVQYGRPVVEQWLADELETSFSQRMLPCPSC